jgi:hypothetical protein
VVRLRTERVAVGVPGQAEQVGVAIPWAGGAVTRHRLVRVVQRQAPPADDPRRCGRRDGLRAAGRSRAAVADGLNREG